MVRDVDEKRRTYEGGLDRNHIFISFIKFSPSLVATLMLLPFGGQYDPPYEKKISQGISFFLLQDADEDSIKFFNLFNWLLIFQTPVML